MRARKSPSLLYPNFQTHSGCSFERYPEDNAASLYGLHAEDVWGHDFPDFEYTSN